MLDTTVQEKNIAFPTDSKLYDTSRKQLVKLAASLGITLRQTYQKQARLLQPKIGRSGHARQFKRMRKAIKQARQFKRMRKAIKQVKGALGRVYRDLKRQLPQVVVLNESQQTQLDHAARLLVQKKRSKNKLYSLYAPEAECISKGKAHKRYEPALFPSPLP